MIEYWQAVLLGIIQGLTEFLPVSSSGHLALAQNVMSIPKPESAEMIFFDVMTHIGTLVAVLVAFWKPAGKFLSALFSQVRTSMPMAQRWQRQWALRLFVLMLVATVVTAMVAFPLKKVFTQMRGIPWAVGILLMITGCLLFSTRFVRRGRRGIRRMGLWTAACIGLAQGFAVAPGISRSGSTISAGLLCGVRRRWAAQFAFLLFVPAVLAAWLVSGLDLLKAENLDVPALIGPTLVGTVVAGLVGYACLRLLLWLVRRSRLWMFAFYCWPIGIAAIVYGLLKSGS